MSDEYYRQCRMERKEGAGMHIHIAWIPEDKAVVGKVLRIDMHADGKFQDGWIVKQVFHGRVGAKEANARSRDFTRQRECSDV